MNTAAQQVCVETELFLFEAPVGFAIETLQEQAELIGSNDEFLVVSCYSIDADSSEQLMLDFAANVSTAMLQAADEPDLIITGKLKKETAPNGLAIWSLLSEMDDQSVFFDQYAAVQGCTAVVVTIEGEFRNRAVSADVEEAVYCIEFK